MGTDPGQCMIYGCYRPAFGPPLTMPGTGVTAYVCPKHRKELLSPPAKRLVERNNHR